METYQILALAMLLGSIPFGYIAVYLRKPGSVRDAGFGLENIRLQAGPGGLGLVVALNIIKGIVPAYTAARYAGSAPFVLITCAVAVLSHCFPYWLIFKPAGKGGSVALGALIGLGLYFLLHTP